MYQASLLGNKRNWLLNKLQQGVAAHKEGKTQGSERCYRAILQPQPAYSDANHNLGVLAASVNKAEAALTLFKTALEAYLDYTEEAAGSALFIASSVLRPLHT